MTKSIGDLPLLANHPLGRAIFQFKSFALAGHQRTMIKAVQAVEMGGSGAADVNSPAVGVLSAMITATSIGMFIYYHQGAGARVGRSPTIRDAGWRKGSTAAGSFPSCSRSTTPSRRSTGVGAYAALARLCPRQGSDRQGQPLCAEDLTSTVFGPTGDFVDTLWRVLQGMQRRDPQDRRL